VRAAALRILRTVNGPLASATRAVVVVAVAVMLVSLGAQVVTRYVFSMALSWSEELSLLLFTWVVLLASALGVREGFHVRMDLIADRLPPLARNALAHVIQVVVLVAGAFLCWHGWRYVMATRGSVSAATGYPIELLHLAAPVGGLLIALFAVERMIDPLPPAAKTP